MVSKYCRLSSPRSDLIIKTRPHAEIIWWGSALKHFSPDDCASLERPVANGRLDIDTPLTLMAENALGLLALRDWKDTGMGWMHLLFFIQLTWNIPKTL